MTFSEQEFIDQTAKARADGQSDIRGAAILICLGLTVLAFLLGYNQGRAHEDSIIARGVLESNSTTLP